MAVPYATCYVLRYGVKQRPIDIIAEVGQREQKLVCTQLSHLDMNSHVIP